MTEKCSLENNAKLFVHFVIKCSGSEQYNEVLSYKSALVDHVYTDHNHQIMDKL